MEEIREQGYHLEFGIALDQTIQNYKKIILYAGLVALVLVIVFYSAVAAGAGVLIGLGAVTESLSGISPNGLTAGQQMVALAIKVGGAVLIAPVLAGIVNMAHLAETGRDFSFSTPFEMYKSRFVKELMLSTLLITFVTQGVNALMDMLNAADDGLSVNLIALSGYLFSLMLTLLTFLTVPLIIFGELNALDAIKGSITLVSKNFWIILGLSLTVLLGATLLGIVALCIGIVFTLPVWYSFTYIVYRTAVSIEGHSEIDEIGQSSEW